MKINFFRSEWWGMKNKYEKQEFFIVFSYLLSLLCFFLHAFNSKSIAYPKTGFILFYKEGDAFEIVVISLFFGFVVFQLLYWLLKVFKKEKISRIDNAVMVCIDCLRIVIWIILISMISFINVFTFVIILLFLVLQITVQTRLFFNKDQVLVEGYILLFRRYVLIGTIFIYAMFLPLSFMTISSGFFSQISSFDDAVTFVFMIFNPIVFTVIGTYVLIKYGKQLISRKWVTLLVGIPVLLFTIAILPILMKNMINVLFLITLMTIYWIPVLLMNIDLVFKKNIE